MAALTTRSLVDRVRSELGDAPYVDICTEAMDTTETGLDVADTTKYSIGNIVEFQDDGEQCLVQALASATTLTVVRNWNYSVTTTAGTGTNHSINAQIAVDGEYAYVDITRAITGVITAELWPHVWKSPTTVDTDGPVLSITPVAGTKWYSIGTAYLSDFEVGTITQVADLTSPNKKIVTYGMRNSWGSVRLQHGLASTISTEYVGLYFPRIHNTTYNILVHLIQPITATQTVPGTYDDMDDNTPAAETLVWLVIARLTLGRELRRTMLADVKMADASVPPGGRTNVSAYCRELGRQARNNWHRYCVTVWPKLPKSRWFRDDTDSRVSL